MPSGSRQRVATAVCAAFFAALPSACADPVVDEVVDALGPERSGVPQGPEHRPGQPCVTCHQTSGPGSPDFSLGGTVYSDQERALPLEGASVEFVDAIGRRHTEVTNCAGNFYITKDEWEPRFPLWTQVRFRDKSIAMETPIYRDGSCASCHADPAAQGSTGHVYVSDEPFDPPTEGCR